MFLLAPSRPTLHAVPYTESFAAFFTFLGMLLFSRGESFLAAVAWAMGSAFRAQGAVLGFGFFGWRYLLQDVWKDGPGFSARQVRVSVTSSRLDSTPRRDLHLFSAPQRLLVNAATFVFLSTLSAIPFLAFETFIYQQFCTSQSIERPWCSQGLGMSYGWVQREYWCAFRLPITERTPLTHYPEQELGLPAILDAAAASKLSPRRTSPRTMLCSIVLVLRRESRSNVARNPSLPCHSASIASAAPTGDRDQRDLYPTCSAERGHRSRPLCPPVHFHHDSALPRPPRSDHPARLRHESSPVLVRRRTRPARPGTGKKGGRRREVVGYDLDEILLDLGDGEHRALGGVLATGLRI